jgi:chitosanase
MNISTETKAVCLAIVSVFETSKVAGDFAAFAVLDDGAGVSYGVGQFTHRSGSLRSVVGEYVESGGVVGRRVLEAALPLLDRHDAAAIAELARCRPFEKALKAAAVTREMRAAQAAVAGRLYFEPSVAACGELGLTLPLSLAVVYDSFVHGSWAKIRGLVRFASPADGGDERTWITSYVRRRHAWLTSSPRLARTAYRTKFFLDQIAVGRWQLNLPLSVNGVLLTKSVLFPAVSAGNAPAAEPAETSADHVPAKVPAADDKLHEAPQREGEIAASRPNTQPPEPHRGPLDAVEQTVGGAARKYDRVEAIVKTVITRKDAAKSLWTTVLGSISQLAWAVAGLAYDVPRSIWFAAAVIMGVLAALYLYRQITLAKIRERAN